MTITNGYCDSEELRDWLNLSDTDETFAVESAIESASRDIDRYCGRRFYTDTAATARVFHPTTYYLAHVHDFHTTSGLVIKTDTGNDGTYATTWTTTDYQLEPLNALNDAGETVPYDTIRAVDALTFPTGHARPAVQVTAQWGWASTPTPVKTACLMQAAKLFRRRNTPEGIASSPEFGAIRVSVRMDPDAEKLLAPYRASGGRGLVVV